MPERRFQTFKPGSKTFIQSLNSENTSVNLISAQENGNRCSKKPPRSNKRKNKKNPKRKKNQRRRRKPRKKRNPRRRKSLRRRKNPRKRKKKRKPQLRSLKTLLMNSHLLLSTFSISKPLLWTTSIKRPQLRRCGKPLILKDSPSGKSTTLNTKVKVLKSIWPITSREVSWKDSETSENTPLDPSVFTEMNQTLKLEDFGSGEELTFPSKSRNTLHMNIILSQKLITPPKKEKNSLRNIGAESRKTNLSLRAWLLEELNITNDQVLCELF